jgi:chromosome segregation ATPase
LRERVQEPERRLDAAQANGSEPIQMWAEWPKAVTLDELVSSRDKLTKWLSDVDEVIFDLRHNARSAESYRASMQGRLGALMWQANDAQKKLLAQKPVDAAGKFKGALAQKAGAEKGPLVAEIASDKEAMAAVQAILDEAKKEVVPLDIAFAALTKDFGAYRKTEADEVATYAALAKQASAAGLDTLAAVEQSILAASLDASKKPNELTLAALKLSAELQQVELALQKALPHDCLLAHGARSPDMTSGALRSINAMLGYLQGRVKRSDAAATALFANIVLRREALELLGAAAPVRAEAMAARQVKARAAFEVMTDARLASPRLASPRLASPRSRAANP